MNTGSAGISATTLTCPKCGKDYVCNPGGDCWCMHVDVKLPVPADAGAICRCPCEFESLARNEAERKDA